MEGIAGSDTTFGLFRWNFIPSQGDVAHRKSQAIPI